MGKIFFNNETTKRVFTKNGAKGFKKVILADELQSGDDFKVILDIENKAIIYTKATEPSTDREVVLICKEFTAYGMGNNFEITLCDDVMIVSVFQGFISYKDATLDENDTTIYDYATFRMDDNRKALFRKKAHRVTTETIKNNCAFWINDNKDFIYDFSFNVIIDVNTFDNKGNEVDGGSVTATFKKGAEPFDLSLGSYEVWNNYRKQKEYEKAIRDALETEIQFMEYEDEIVDIEDDYDYESEEE